MKFYKLYTPPAGRNPREKIEVYYHGLPLFVEAVFEHDRYCFRLPLNLRDKMITGNLYADLCYIDSGSGPGSKWNPIPVSMVLSDRYD